MIILLSIYGVLLLITDVVFVFLHLKLEKLAAMIIAINRDMETLHKNQKLLDSQHRILFYEGRSKKTHKE